MIFLQNFFYINLYSSLFLILSSILPTGFKSTFFYLSLISAIIIIFYFFLQNKSYRLFGMNYEKIGLILFFWIALSSLFSSTTLSDALNATFEYRVFLICPLFACIVSATEFKPKAFSHTMVVGASTALFASFLGAIGLVDFAGESRSLGNSIFHGFSMSVLVSVALFFSRKSSGLAGLGWLILAALVVFSVFGIEVGRTAYLQIIGCLTLFIITDPKSLKTWRIVFFLLGCLVFSFVISSDFEAVLNRTLSGTMDIKPPSESADRSSALRLDWWFYSLTLIKDNWVTGIGLSEIPMYLNLGHKSDLIKVPTDNLHSEFLTMFLGTGIFGFLLLFLYFAVMFFEGFRLYVRNQSLSSYFLMVLPTIFIIGCVFNSSLKDFGEKHLMICILSVATGLLGRRPELDFSRPSARVRD